MLLGDFFTILKAEPSSTDPELNQVSIRLNPDHRVYQGHFPGNPVVPGVCQVQMIREIAEHLHHFSGRLITGSQIKFLNMIVPSEHPVLTADCKVRQNEPGTFSVDASLRDGELIFLKFKGTLCTKAI